MEIITIVLITLLMILTITYVRRQRALTRQYHEHLKRLVTMLGVLDVHITNGVEHNGLDEGGVMAWGVIEDAERFIVNVERGKR